MSVLDSQSKRASNNPIAIIGWGGLAAFCAYFSMYAFRKPFAAGLYQNVDGWNIEFDYKIALVIAQVAGYAASKVIGVKLISEMSAAKRGVAIVGLILLAWFALVTFAVLPPHLKIIAMFLNGLPLGMIWGLIFGYLEGRRTTEILGAILCASFIVSSGMVKSVAIWLMVEHGVSEFWMPASTGALFLPLLFVSVWKLSALPPPDAEDVALRVERKPMFAKDRRAFMSQYGPGILWLVLSYVLFTAIRDFRDNFASDIWATMNYEGIPSVFTTSELPIAVATLVVLGSLIAIKDNVRALMAIHIITFLGAALIGISTLLFSSGYMSPLQWMITSGAGLYFAYTPFNAMLFDRLIAATRQIGTAGFLIYLADASGYIGSVVLLLYRHFGAPELDWLKFFQLSAYTVSIVGMLFVLLSARYFAKKLRTSS